MQTTATLPNQARADATRPYGVDSTASGVSWGAIFAGAAGAAALSLILLILGFGLGLSALSPWSGQGAESSTVGLSSIIWVAFTQIAAAGVGGYLAGRLRVKWSDLHGDEVYFRDTAHGFLAWAIASLATVTLLGAAASAALTGGLQAGATVASGVGGAATSVAGAAAASASKDTGSDTNSGGKSGNSVGYFVDNLFRNDTTTADNRDAATVEAGRIFAYDLRSGELSAEDKQHLGQLIAKQTGVTQEEGEKRATDVFYQLTTSIAKAEMTAKETADKARKAAAHTSLWMFVALLAGAFFASISATMGGRQRDSVA